MSAPMPTDRELQALKILWQRGRATVREIWRELSRTEDELAYTTVLSLMQTMEQKGLVDHEVRGRAYAYFANVQRKGTVQRLADRFIERVFDGAMDEYLVHALEARGVSLQELDRLEQMISEAKRRKRQPKKRKGRL